MMRIQVAYNSVVSVAVFMCLVALTLAPAVTSLAQTTPPSSGGTSKVDTLEDGRISVTLKPGNPNYRRLTPEELQRLGQPATPRFVVADCIYKGKRGMWLLDSLGDTVQHVSSRPGSASWSADQVRFICVSPRLKLKILALDKPRGGIVVNLPDGLYPERPAWSPVEDLIAFAAKDKNGIRQIYLVKPNAAGTDFRQLTFFGTSVTAPAWRPDGKAITFTLLSAEMVGIYAIPVGGGEIDTLYKSDSIPLVDGVWSPNGEYLLAQNPPSGNIFRIDSDGSNLLNVTKVGQTQFPFVAPRFVDDGEFFLCASKRPGSKGPELFKVPIGGGALIGVTDPNDELYVAYAVANR
ncbi:MAG: TolB family protein [Candidatus Zixiibacteriota bacterium]